MTTAQQQVLLDQAIIVFESRKESVHDLQKAVEDYSNQQPVPFDDLADHLEVLESELEELSSAKDTVLKKMVAAKRSELEYKAEDKKMNKNLRDVSIIISRARRIIGANAQKTKEAVEPVSTLKMPEIQITKLSGSVREWLPFWSQFQKIHGNKNLTDSDKFQMLLQSTEEKSEARDVVTSFSLGGQGYEDAVAQLEQMYGNEKLLVRAYIRDLLSLVTDKAQKKQTSLSALFFKLSAKLKALKTLNVTSDKCASVVLPLVEGCLPEETLKAWLNSTKCQEAANSELGLKALLEFMQREVDNEKSLQEASQSLNSEEGGAAKQKKKKNEESVPTAAALVNVGKKTCIFCDGSTHESSVCGTASSKMSLKQKEDAIRQKNACFKCLRPNAKKGHKFSTCKTFVTCMNCGKIHQTILCPESAINKMGDGERGNMDQKAQRKDEKKAADEKPPVTQKLLNQCRSPDVMFPTVRVKVYGANGDCEGRVLFDSGSHHSYSTKRIILRAGMKNLGYEDQNHGVFGGGVTGSVRHKKYKLYISALDGSNCVCFDVADCEQISTEVNEIPPGPWTEELEDMGHVVPDKGCNTSPIDILIGADVLSKLVTGKKFALSCEPGLDAWETVFGWTYAGKLSTHALTGNRNAMMVISLVNKQDVAKLWELDAIGITDSGEKKSREELEQAALEHFKSTVKVNEDGRFEVHLPFIQGHKPLPDNRAIAYRRLLSTTAILKRDGTFEKYDELLKMWEEAGIIEEVKEEGYGNVHYLPHRPVYKPSSKTTPIRPVFDASCRARGSCSLNDCLEKGPNLVELIPAVITRGRKNKKLVSGDIKRAFPQISVTPAHRDFQRFLWWLTKECKKVKIYRHCRLVFGESSSPFILGAVIQLLLEMMQSTFPETSEFLKQAFYIDNLIDSVSTDEHAEKLKVDSIEIMKSGKFEMQDWEIGPNGEQKEVKLLGMIWDTGSDTLKIDLDQAIGRLDGPVTKRKILSMVHSIFDPIGVTAPFTLVPKLMLQELWEKDYGWDDELPSEIEDQFGEWKKQIPELMKLKIPRYLKADTVPQEKWELFVFVDASQKAYAACVYLKCGDVLLVQAKARVAPLKKLTIPRLELMSCVIGVRLANSVKDYLGGGKIKTWYFTDSSTALYWIQHDENWGLFVENRRKEIVKFSDVTDWGHIPGEENPADFPSRGGTVKQLLQKRFWEGPRWIMGTMADWPYSVVNANREDVDAERKKTVVSIVNTNADTYGWVTDEFQNLENYEEMLLHVLTFRGWERNPENMEKAEMELLLWVQKSTFEGKEDKVFKKIPVYEDDAGYLRLKTRLSCGAFTEEFTFPVILPSKNEVVKAMIMLEHIKHSHAGVQALMAIMRERWWILKARKTIRNVLKKCEECQRFDAKPIVVEPGPLPKDRMQAEVPFQVTGVDLFGPLFLDDGSKCWVSLFTCAVYRAVHLEIVTSMDTPSFKNALRRFVGRRGRPSVIYSDNGRNFLGLNNAFQKIDWHDVLEYAAVERIQWKFNPPTASWWGGFFERMVGVVKRLLRRVLGKTQLSYEDLETILCDVECTVNLRPLTYVSEDPEDLKPLTPFMFLTGNVKAAIPEADVMDSGKLNKKWHHIQQMRDELRVRFEKEYLGQLCQLRDVKPSLPLRIGEKVLIGRDNAKRIDWPMGIVEELIKSQRDGKVRLVRVRTEDGITTRPIQRIYPLEYRETDDEQSEENPKEEENTEDPPVVKTRSGREVRIPKRLTFVAIG